MTPLVLLGVALLGGAGAVARFLVHTAVTARSGGAPGLGTLAVNLSGTLALGLVAGAAVSDDTARLVATGLLGSYTTFSTLAVESHRLAENGRRGAAALNLAGSLVLGVLVAWIGLRLGRAL